MPLDKRKSISELIRQLRNEGKREDVAQAIAYSVKGKSKSKRGKKHG